ncbi:hypothetical protein AAFF_G00193810 [Aldrovandia affinis]|uniref:Immunoglobulin V-set domain-containing protein n=1 Tax=Aldrovandia affinis TaxID=143900 RepID=A0AAD7SX95_9TELE|nr:hypothetical protein AAFF_G00193810 [Aldrovandia affinis]
METHWMNGSMWTILILLTSVLFSACSKVTIHAIVGKDVLLPCTCLENKDPFLVWQIGQTIVAQYIHRYNQSNIAPRFQGRTCLFLHEEAGNCSMLLSRVTAADNETFTCHYKNPMYSSSNITLIVSMHGMVVVQPPSPEYGKNRVAYAVGGIILAIVVLVTVVLMVRYRERRLRSRANVPGPQQVEQTEPLELSLV